MHRTASLLSVACLLGTAFSAPHAKPNIVQLAASVPDLSTLVTALKAAGAPSLTFYVNRGFKQYRVHNGSVTPCCSVVHRS